MAPDLVVASGRAGLDKELLPVDPAAEAFTPLLADSATVVRAPGGRCRIRPESQGRGRRS